MANRQNKFLIKRSNVAGKIPTAGDLALGEMALNTADVILYTSGTTANEILPIGWDRINRTGDTMTGPLFAPSFSATTFSGGTYYGDGSNLSGISTDNFYTTGATALSGTVYFDRSDTLSAYTLDLSAIAGDISETIWAEDNGPLVNGAREWSFGNGSEGVCNVYIMYDGKITKMFIQAESPGTTATIDVMINDSVAGTGSWSANGVYTFSTPISVSAGDSIGFQTNTVTGTWTDVRTGVALVQTIYGLKGDTGDAGPAFTGGTINGFTTFTNGLSATTISATTYYGDGSNLTGIDNFYVTGATYSTGGTLTLTRNDAGSVNVLLHANQVDLDRLTTDIVDALVSASTPTNENPFATIADLAAGSGDTKQVKVSGNDTTEGFLEDKLSGGTNITLTTINEGGNERVLISSSFDANTYVTGSTYDGSTNTITLTRNDAVTIDTYIDSVSGLTINGDLLITGDTIGSSFSATSISATTFYGDGSNLTGAGLESKSGIEAGSGFTGNPKVQIVTFSTAFSDNNYTVTITGEDSRSWSVNSKSSTGFTINSNANPPLTGNVFWQAIKVGES